MNKLIGFFALTSMAAAVVVGCSVEAPDVDLSGSDSGTETPDDEDGGTTAPRRVPTRARPWRPPRPPRGRQPVTCARPSPRRSAYNNPIAVANVLHSERGSQDLTNLLLNGQGTEPSEGCLQCAITERTAAAWGPIFNGQNDVGFPLNLGGCARRSPARRPAAAKGPQNAEDCRFVVSEPCSTNEPTTTRASTTRARRQCDKFSAAVDTGCSRRTSRRSARRASATARRRSSSRSSSRRSAAAAPRTAALPEPVPARRG